MGKGGEVEKVLTAEALGLLLDIEHSLLVCSHDDKPAVLNTKALDVEITGQVGHSRRDLVPAETNTGLGAVVDLK